MIYMVSWRAVFGRFDVAQRGARFPARVWYTFTPLPPLIWSFPGRNLATHLQTECFYIHSCKLFLAGLDASPLRGGLYLGASRVPEPGICLAYRYLVCTTRLQSATSKSYDRSLPTTRGARVGTQDFRYDGNRSYFLFQSIPCSW